MGVIVFMSKQLQNCLTIGIILLLILLGDCIIVENVERSGNK